MSFEIDDDNPEESFGGAEVWENEELSGAAATNFHLIYYPKAYHSSTFDFGEVDMTYVPYPGPTYVSYFVDPRTNEVFNDSRSYFDRLDLALTSGNLVPTPSGAMVSAATGSPALLDYILVIRRL